MSPKYPLLLVPSTGAAAVDTLHSGDCHSRSASPSQHTVVSIVPCVTFYILMLPSNPGPEEWTLRTRWTAGDMTQVVAQEAQCPARSRPDALCVQWIMVCYGLDRDPRELHSGKTFHKPSANIAQ